MIDSRPGWMAGRPRAGWALAVAAGVAGVLVGAHIRWQASSPGFAALGAFFEAVLVGGVVLLGVVTGGVMVALHRPRGGQLLLMPAIALAAASGLGFVAGPTYRATVVQNGTVELVLTQPKPVEIQAVGTCIIPENSDTVRGVTAVSAGYVLGERVSVSLALSVDGQAEVVLSRGQELADPPRVLPPYGAVDGSSVSAESGEDNREGRVVFAGLGPMGDGRAWGLGSEPVRLDGEVRWSCDPGEPQLSSQPQAVGTIEFGGAVDGTLGLGGGCVADHLVLDFSAPPSGKELPDPQAEGDPVSGTLARLDEGWELTLFRPGTDLDAELVLAERADFRRETDAAGAVVGDRLEAEFQLSYGAVSVVATWRCEPGVVEGG